MSGAWRTDRATGRKFRVDSTCPSCPRDPYHDETILWFQRVLGSLKVPGGVWIVPYLNNAVIERIEKKTLIVRSGELDDKMRYYIEKAGYTIVEGSQ